MARRIKGLKSSNEINLGSYLNVLYLGQAQLLVTYNIRLIFCNIKHSGYIDTELNILILSGQHYIL